MNSRFLLSCLPVWALLLLPGHVRNVTELRRSWPTSLHQKLEWRSRWTTFSQTTAPTLVMLPIVKPLFLTSGKLLPCNCGLRPSATYVLTLKTHVKVDISWPALNASLDLTGSWRHSETLLLRDTGFKPWLKAASVPITTVDWRISARAISRMSSQRCYMWWLKMLGSLLSALTLDVKNENKRIQFHLDDFDFKSQILLIILNVLIK